MSKYGLMAKVSGEMVYLNRKYTSEYNTSKMETPQTLYYFGVLGDDTLLAEKEEWNLFLSSKRFREISECFPEIDFTAFRMAFVRVEIEYETQICSPFVLQGVLSCDGTSYSNFNAEINWDSFC